MFAVHSRVSQFHQISTGPGWSLLGCHRDIPSPGFMRFLKRNSEQSDRQTEQTPLTTWAPSLIVCLIEFHSSRSSLWFTQGGSGRGGETLSLHDMWSDYGQLHRHCSDINNSSMHRNEVSGECQTITITFYSQTYHPLYPPSWLNLVGFLKKLLTVLTFLLNTNQILHNCDSYNILTSHIPMIL